MAKIITTICIDFDIQQEAKRLNLNVSGEVNEFLRNLINRKNTDVTSINYELEKSRYDNMSKKLSEMQADLLVSDAKLKKFKELEQAEKEHQLQKEKEHIEKMKKCYNCGTVFGETYQKWQNFGKVKICKGCFLSADNDSIKRWENAE